MSVVTGVVLCTSICESSGDDETGLNWTRVNAWLVERGFAELKRIDDGFSGTKHPQMIVAGAGFNHFDAEAFATFVRSLPWEYPENMVLVMQPEDGSSGVYRPG